jgi:hypothetical protein
VFSPQLKLSHSIVVPDNLKKARSPRPTLTMDDFNRTVVVVNVGLRTIHEHKLCMELVMNFVLVLDLHHGFPERAGLNTVHSLHLTALAIPL